MEGKIFWLDKYEGECQGGYFYRNDLFKAFEQFEKNGFEIVGIKIGDGWNIEFICKEKSTIQKEKTHNGN